MFFLFAKVAGSVRLPDRWITDLPTKVTGIYLADSLQVTRESPFLMPITVLPTRITGFDEGMIC